MSKDFEIEFQEKEVEETDNIQLPMNFLTFGEIENDDVKVYIKQDVYKALEKLATSDTSKELGSILFGEYAQELGKTHVIISDYIEAKYTDASASTLTFTHETWDYVHKEHEKQFPEKKIVGWQHTHPNYGVFLSNYDFFIQENFFNMPFQVAYVIDPIQNIRGFFQWKNEKIEKLNGYYIYDEIGKPIKIEQTKVTKTKEEQKNSSKLLYATIAALTCFCIILGGSLISMKNEYQKRFDKQETIVEDINTILEQQETVIAEQADAINNLHTDEKQENEVTFTVYKVEKGDSLSSICDKMDIDYSENYHLILRVNGIKEPNKIFVGQNLLLPSVSK